MFDGPLRSGMNGPSGAEDGLAAFVERVRVLAKTARLLGELLDGPRHKAALAEELGVSKSTIYHWASDLDDHGLLTRTDEGYQLTSAGVYHTLLFERVATHTHRIDRSTPITERIPNEELPPLELLLSATAVRTMRDPRESDEAMTRLLEGADRLIGMSPIVYSPHIDVLEAALTDGGLSIELAFARDAIEYLRTEHEGFLRAVAADPGSRLLAFEGKPSYSVTVFEGTMDTVGVAGCSDAGYPTGFLASRSPVAVEWGRQRYRAYAAGAEPVESAGASQESA